MAGGLHVELYDGTLLRTSETNFRRCKDTLRTAIEHFSLSQNVIQIYSAIKVSRVFTCLTTCGTYLLGIRPTLARLGALFDPWIAVLLHERIQLEDRALPQNVFVIFQIVHQPVLNKRECFPNRPLSHVEFMRTRSHLQIRRYYF